MNFVDRWRSFMKLSLEKRLRKIMNFAGCLFFVVAFINFLLVHVVAYLFLLLSILCFITDAETVLRKVGYYKEKRKY